MMLKLWEIIKDLAFKIRILWAIKFQILKRCIITIQTKWLRMLEKLKIKNRIWYNNKTFSKIRISILVWSLTMSFKMKKECSKW